MFQTPAEKRAAGMITLSPQPNDFVSDASRTTNLFYDSRREIWRDILPTSDDESEPRGKNVVSQPDRFFFR